MLKRSVGTLPITRIVTRPGSLKMPPRVNTSDCNVPENAGLAEAPDAACSESMITTAEDRSLLAILPHPADIAASDTIEEATVSSLNDIVLTAISPYNLMMRGVMKINSSRLSSVNSLR